jgi:hypothetical protein
MTIARNVAKDRISLRRNSFGGVAKGTITICRILFSGNFISRTLRNAEFEKAEFHLVEKFLCNFFFMKA